MPFGSTLPLMSLAPNLWAGDADPAYAHPGGRFGGYTAALLLKAAMEEDGERGPPLSLTVLYTDAVNDGPFTISTRLLRSGSRLQFWRSELSQNDKVCAHAQITFGVRRAASAFTDAVMPVIRPPSDPALQLFQVPTRFGQQLETWWDPSAPWIGGADLPARTVNWSRHSQGYALDHVMLALLADYGAPRPMVKRQGPLPSSSTVSMNVYFHATPDEIASVGSAHVLTEIDGRRSEGGYFDHSLKLWSRSGALLATSEQVAAFRE